LLPANLQNNQDPGPSFQAVPFQVVHCDGRQKDAKKLYPKNSALFQHRQAAGGGEEAMKIFDRQARLNKALCRAARRGEEAKALLALSRGAAVDGDPAGTMQTPLVQAILAGKLPMVCLLVEKGADVQGAPSERITPLIHAVEQGDAAIVRFLIESGAPPDAVHTHTQKTVYERTEDEGIFGLFADVYYHTVETVHRLTALTLAAHQGKSEIVRILLEAGASRDLIGKDGKTALACAEANGHARVAALLRPAAAPVRKQAAQAEQTKKTKKTEQTEKTEKTEKAAPSAGDIVFRRELGACFLEEIYDFTVRERVSLIRRSETGPVECATREAFDAIADAPALRAAFEEHVRRGGTVPEKQVFARRLNKPRLERPRKGRFGP
jgi:ankyrin repeat protein